MMSAGTHLIYCFLKSGHFFSLKNNSLSRLLFKENAKIPQISLGSLNRTPFKTYFFIILNQHNIGHSLIRGVLIQSCSAGAKKFTNYVFCHPQFSGVIQNIENRCAVLTPVCLWQLLSK